MKILLIIPPEFPRYPIPYLGILYIAASLKENDIDCSLIDCRLLDIENSMSKFINDKAIYLPTNYEILTEKILSCDFDIVGITATTLTINSAAKIAQLIKKKYPNKKIIVGGIHVSALPIQTLEEFACFDIVVKGEGEKTIVELLKELERSDTDLKKIKNIVFRNGDKIVETENGFLLDVNKLPLPAKHLAPMKKYQEFLDKSLYLGKDANAYGMLITSRGCPALCTYCASNVAHGRKFRGRNPENVFEEIVFLYNKYDVRRLILWDDNFTWHKKRAMQICDLIIKNKLKLKFSCFARVNTIDEELLKKMKKAGCISITYGIETGSERVLKDLKKGSTLTQAKNAIQLTKKLGISPASGFMLGNPTDNIQSIKETIHFAKKLVYAGLDTAGFFITVPYPGTEMYKKEYNKIKFFEWEDYSHTGMGISYSMLKPSNLSVKDLLIWQRKAYKTFNRNLILREIFKKNFKPLQKAIIIKINQFINFIKKYGKYK